MTTIIPFALRRTTLVPKMADDLIKAGTQGNERDAIRTLQACGYPMTDIIMLIDIVRQVAQQEIVAREMSAP